MLAIFTIIYTYTRRHHPQKNIAFIWLNCISTALNHFSQINISLNVEIFSVNWTHRILSNNLWLSFTLTSHTKNWKAVINSYKLTTTCYITSPEIETATFSFSVPLHISFERQRRSNSARLVKSSEIDKSRFTRTALVAKKQQHSNSLLTDQLSNS